MENHRQCERFIVQGRVQCVGFRYHTAHYGLQLGVTGYAKNLPSGEVEVIVCGTQVQRDKMRAYLEVGPKTARVDSLASESVDYKHYQGFDIL